MTGSSHTGASDGRARPRNRARWLIAGGFVLLLVIGAIVVVPGAVGLVGEIPRERIVDTYWAAHGSGHSLTLNSDGTYHQRFYIQGGKQIIDPRNRAKTWTVTHRGARTTVHFRNYTSQADLVRRQMGQPMGPETDVDMDVYLPLGSRLQLAPLGERRYTLVR